MPFKEQKVFLNEGDTTRLPDFSVPIGILDLAAYIERHVGDICIELLDFSADLHKVFRNNESHRNSDLNLNKFYKSEIESVSMEPDIVGISILYSTSYYSSLELAKLAREKWPNALLICGGNHSSAYYQEVLKSPYIDLVFRGEAEIPLVQFLQEYQASNGKVNTEIQGVYDREKASNYSDCSETAVMLENLDEIGLPAYKLLDINFYLSTSIRLGLDEGSMSTMWSRGCPFKCTFCATSVVHGRRIRDKSNEFIVEELKHIKSLGFKTITIYDDLFAAKPKKFLELEKELEQIGIVGNTNFLIPNALNVMILNEDVIDAITRMNAEYFRVAIESGSQYTQNNIIKKHVNLKKARKLLKYMRTKDLPIEVNFVLGFPGETKDLMQETIDFIATIDVDWVLVFSALPLPGTELYQQFIDEGAIDQETFDWDMNRMPLRDFDTKEIGKDELAQLVYDINIYWNFFNNSNVRKGRYERFMRSLNTHVIKRYPFHVVGLYCRATVYQKMGEQKKSEQDFQRCVKLINNDERSTKMYHRYFHKMELLKEYFTSGENELHQTMAPDAVTVFPSITGSAL
jgi:anaerobic magnesium-protoporphyrin IX monomethyl ester cyclase